MPHKLRFLPRYRNRRRSGKGGFFDSRARSEVSAIAVGQKIPAVGGPAPTEDQMLSKKFNMPFLSLHPLAATRGEGLRPEFVELFKRLAAGADATLSETAQLPAEFAVDPVKDEPISNGPRQKRV
jgi:hypothetical protein